MVFKKSPVLRNRGTDILSAIDYYRKRADIVEEISGTKIDLVYKDTGTNYVYQESNGNVDSYIINLCKPAVVGIPANTALYHELSHVLHKTFLTGMLSIMKKESNVECERIYPKILNGSIDDSIIAYWAERLYDLYKASFNILEDQRIESLTMKIWLGTKHMFIEMRQKVGNRLSKDITVENRKDPICQMLMYRFLHPEICDIKELSDGIDKVSGCNEDGSVIIWKRMIKPIIDTYFFNLLKDRKDNRSTNGVGKLPEDSENVGEKLDKLNKELEKKEEELSNIKSDILTIENSSDGLGAYKRTTTGSVEKDEEGNSILSDPYIEAKDKQEKLVEEIEALTKTIDILDEEVNQGVSNARYMPNFSIKSSEYDYHRGMDGKFMNNSDQNDINKSNLKWSGALEETETLDTALSLSKKDGDDQIEEIKNALIGMQVPKEPAHIHKEKRQTVSNTPQPNNTITNGLTNILRKIKEKNTTTIGESGDEIDIDSYINVKQKGFGDAFETIKTDNGIPIMITIDGSGSMGNEQGRGQSCTNIQKARDLVASLFKVSQQHKEITVQANIWSSDQCGNVAVTDIKTLHDCNQISCDVLHDGNNYCETPTHEGILYSARKLKEMRGRNKMLIIITDGLPQFTKNNIRISDKVILTLCKNAYRQAQSVTRNILCINIEKRSYTAQEMLKDIFGKNYVEFNGMDEASEFVNKILKRKFVEIFGR